MRYYSGRVFHDKINWATGSLLGGALSWILLHQRSHIKRKTFSSKYTQVGSLSKVYYIRIQNHIISWVWKPACNKLWMILKSHVISQKPGCHISGTTYRRKIVLYSIFVQRSRFWGYFLSFFRNMNRKLVKNKKNWKKAIAFFSGGPHCSEMAYHAISTFGP